jgi:Kef-type K+ transport system membrane component KefB
MQLTLIIVSAQLLGILAEKMGQVKVIGEIVAGLVLGPSLFGFLSPAAYHFVFKSVPSQSLYFIGQIGLVLLMFQTGLEFDFSNLKILKNKITPIFVALCGFTLPFLMGIIIGWFSRPYLAPTSHPIGYILFCGTALCFTAVPVLGRIMIDLGATNLPVSGITMMAASITDILGWFLLAIVITVISADFQFSAFITQLVLFFAYIFVCLYIVRPLLLKLIAFLDARQHALTTVIPTLLAAIFLSGLTTSFLGLHSAFGGLMIGLLMRRHHGLVDHWKKNVAGFINASFVPVFFAYAGSHTELGRIASWNLFPWMCLFLGAAVFGKFGGSYLAGRVTGLNPSEARVVGILMNTRGVIELIALTIGLDLGIIPSSVYAVLVFMAVVTTLMTVPLLKLWMPYLIEHKHDDSTVCAVQRV